MALGERIPGERPDGERIPEAVRRLNDLHVIRVQASGLLYFSSDQRVRVFMAEADVLNQGMQITGRRTLRLNHTQLQEASDWIMEHPKTEGIRTELVQSNLAAFMRAAQS